MEGENTVFVGGKRTMSYVLATVMHFQRGVSRVVLKARGKAISKAVDAAQIVISRFLPDVKVLDVRIGSERLTSGDRERLVSTIEITLGRELAR